jgi:hypothetical protein
LEGLLNWTDRLQKRFGFLAIPGLGRYIVGLQLICFVIGISRPDVLDSLRLDPSMVADGQWWRLVSFLFLPSLTPFNIFFAIFYFVFQWMVFQSLESEWGAFKLTLYCALGWVCALSLPLLAWALSGGAQNILSSGAYWSVSIELAFAYLYPDTMIYLYMIVPVKMKWMAWLIGVFLLYEIFTQGLSEALPIGVGLLNYLVFFGPDYVARSRHAYQVHKGRQVFSAAKREADSVLAPRACCQCGAGPDKELRLCACERCGDEGKIWCVDHLPAHLEKIRAGGVAKETGNPAATGNFSPSAIQRKTGKTHTPKPKRR